MNQHNLNEKLFIPDTKNLVEVGSVDGVSLYSSNKLKLDFVESINNSRVGNHIGPAIEKLVMEDRVIPCWLNKGLTSRFFFKVFSKSVTKNFEGFYDQQNKKVYILIDNNTNFFNFSTNNNIARITIHETLHMLAFKRPALFFRTFKKEIEDFYNVFHENVFDIRRSGNYRSDLLMDILKDYPRKYGLTRRDIIHHGNIVERIYRESSSLSEKEFFYRLQEYVRALYLMAVNVRTYLRNYKNYDEIIYKPLQEAYKQVFGTTVKNKMLFQEVYSPSEIISVASEIKITPNMIKGISALK